jgi:glycosyltransferase involved in cell wall biosynthesis
MKQKITANIITLNEEENIADAIRSVQTVCDEVLVVDSQSKDKTREIAESLGAKVVVQPYLGDGPQKAFGAPLAKNEWILSLDADERLDANAIKAIEKLDLEHTAYDAFSFRRKTFVGKHFIKLWYPDRLVRLYNRNSAGFTKAIGHAKVNATKVKELDADLLHYTYRDYAHMINNIGKFASRGAKMLHAKGKRAYWYDPFLHGGLTFFKKLVIKGGMFHGMPGWTVSIISGFNTYMKYMILIEMQENEAHGDTAA